ncbi:MAG TPA: hypothetical protein VNW06_11560 [Cytophagaceae bacterium]|jgi:hypothetical protein|nr:hypothetical protein [Cytophagaceae bacterium]
MQKITNTVDLKIAIQQLENKKAEEWPLLKDQFHVFYENSKPLNIIRNTFKEFIASPDLKTTLINGAIGLATGFVTKKIVVGNTHNPITKLLGYLVEMVVAKKVTGNADEIKSFGSSFLSKIFNSQKDSTKA